MRRLYVTSIVQANNCSHMMKLKYAGVEPLPLAEPALAGIVFERAVSFFLPRSNGVSAEESVAAANDCLNNHNIINFIKYALENLPAELLNAYDVSFSVQSDREFDDESIIISGFIDLVADNNIYELKYTQKYMNQPSKSHIFQLQHYMFLLDKEEANIVYACNTKYPSILAFKVKRWSHKKYISLIKTLASRYYEDAPAGLIHDWQCDYCSFRHVCEYYNEENEIILSHEAKLP